MCIPYVFLASSDSEVLQKVKKSKMKKSAIKDLIYGGVEEILNNRNYFYHSTIGRDYSHLTDDGKAAILEYMEIMAWKIKQAEDEDLESRAKKQVLDALKGKNEQSKSS